MTPELQKYYEDRFSMMATEGWKDLVEDIDNMIYALNNISVIESDKSRYFYNPNFDGSISGDEIKKFPAGISETVFSIINKK